MGVNVDEAWRDDLSRRVQLIARFFVHLAYRDNAPVADADIGSATGRAAAIDHFSINYLEIQHCIPPHTFERLRFAAASRRN
jgi:hypothetical protein